MLSVSDQSSLSLRVSMISIGRLLPVRALRLSTVCGTRLYLSSVSALRANLTAPAAPVSALRAHTVLRFQPPPASLSSIARHFSSGGDGKDSAESAAYDVRSYKDI